MMNKVTPKHIHFAAHTPPQDRPDAWHSLSAHLNKVANLARHLASKFGAGDLGYYAGLWHDLGKYNPAFQRYLEQCHEASISNASVPRSKVPHAIYGAKLAAEQFQPLSPLIFGHHAGLPHQTHMKNRLAEVDTTTYEAIIKAARTENIDLIITASAAQQLTNIAQDCFSFEVLLRLLFSCLVDADYLDTERHFSSEVAQQRGSGHSIAKLWKTLDLAQKRLVAQVDKTPVNQVREEVYQACLEAASQRPGVFRLAVPTGGGKTLSGLAFALSHAVENGLDRVIVAVPYTSIIEQTVEVYRSIFGHDAVLEHHSAVLPDEKNDEDARSRQAQARLATQNWDAPLIVTTTVQLFESLFANRTSRCRKLHNIVNSVIILDEVQTLPVGLLEPILSVLKELCCQYQVSLVLCTATQPALEGETPYLKGFEAGTVSDIVSKSLAKAHFAALRRVQYAVPKEALSWAEVGQAVSQHDQALVILNTRKDALAVLDELTTGEDSDHFFHLSTLLCGQHRRQVLNRVRERLDPHDPRPCILVSTQVVEAGVDLDFPVVYRAAGPLDRIVQAAGRCNREGCRTEKGQVVVFRPQDGKMPPGEYRKAFEETEILLKRENLNWDDPAIFNDYFHRLYQGLDLDSKGVQPYREAHDFPEVAARFKLIPDDTTAVLIGDYDDFVQDKVKQIKRYGLRPGDLRTLQPYLVNLRDREFRETEDLRELIAPGLWLWQGGYDKKKGISVGASAILRDPADLIV